MNHAINPVFSLNSFNVLPKFVGIWEGDWHCLDSQSKIKKTFKATLDQRIINNQWVQKNHNIYSDNSNEIWRFFGEPSSTHEVILTSPDSPYDQFSMRIKEVDKNLILLQVWDKNHQHTLAIETIYLANDKHRIRTMLQFDQADNLRGFMTINERKIAD